MRNAKFQSGFTLVELAIAMIVIGLIIGGVLKGQELIENSRISSVIAQYKNVSAAYYTFNDLYKGIPGDIVNAQQVVPNCTAANFCVNGNGNRKIGPAAVSWEPVPSDINSENIQFWKHLALADLSGGVDGSASVAAFGKTNPPSALKGGLFVREGVATTAASVSGFTYNNAGMTGTMLVMKSYPDGRWCGYTADPVNSCAISGAQASKIDRKIDDGIALAGAVQTVSHFWENGCGIPNYNKQNSAGYDPQNFSTSCDIMFEIR